MSDFARTIYKNKYAHRVNGRKEEWPETAERVARCVMRTHLPDLEGRVRRMITERKFIPGGRYLYAAGRRFQQYMNCLRGDTRFVTKDGVRTLKEMSGQRVEVLNRFGEWEDAEVRSFGKQRLFKVTFTNGDVVYATAGHRWWQPDGTVVRTPQLQRCPLTRPSSPPLLDEEGIRHGIVYGDGQLYSGGRRSEVLLCTPEKEQLACHFNNEEMKIQTGNSGFITSRPIRRRPSTGLVVSLQPKHYKTLPDTRTCTQSYARGFIAGLIATDGSVKTSSITISVNGRANAEAVRDLAVLGGCVVSGIHVQEGPTNFGNRSAPNCVVRIKPFSAPLVRPDQVREVGRRNLRPTKMWVGVESVEDTGVTEDVYCCVVPGSRSFTLANGLTTGNCFLFRAEDSREGWADLQYKTTNALMTGGGIGIVYSNVRPYGFETRGMGGIATGPMSLAGIVNEQGRRIMQGGSRRSAIWAGLHWWHPDIFKLIHCKDWSEDVRALKRKDFNFPGDMDMTNVSTILDPDFFDAVGDPSWRKTYRLWGTAFDVTAAWASQVYWESVRGMRTTAEPGFSIDFGNPNESLRNACSESTSEDDSDVCDLGSMNLGRYDSFDEFAEDVSVATAFLLVGTMVSDIPIAKTRPVMEKNRRIGLGVMGVHEWLLKRGYKYGPNSELAGWMAAYAENRDHADEWADRLHVARPVKTRSIAPTGTISIVGETTSGIEPVLAVAQKRRYLDGKDWKAQYIVDPTAHRLVQSGVHPGDIEDAMTLARDYQRRVEFQVFMQSYVDQAISSTLNLAPFGSEHNNEGHIKPYGEALLPLLPQIRGITAYPDGSRDGQPLNPVAYEEAVKQLGVEFIDQSECRSGVCGS